MKKLDIKYAAGILDGEGYVGITKSDWRKNNKVNRSVSTEYKNHIEIKMKLLPETVTLMNDFKFSFGGIVHQYKNPYKNNSRYVAWIISAKEARKFAKKIVNHCKLKKEELKCFAEFDKLVSGNRTWPGRTDVNLIKKEQLYKRCKSLKNKNR